MTSQWSMMLSWWLNFLPLFHHQTTHVQQGICWNLSRRRLIFITQLPAIFLSNKDFLQDLRGMTDDNLEQCPWWTDCTVYSGTATSNHFYQNYDPSPEWGWRWLPVLCCCWPGSQWQQPNTISSRFSVSSPYFYFTTWAPSSSDRTLQEAREIWTWICRFLVQLWVEIFSLWCWGRWWAPRCREPQWAGVGPGGLSGAGPVPVSVPPGVGPGRDTAVASVTMVRYVKYNVLFGLKTLWGFMVSLFCISCI